MSTDDARAAERLLACCVSPGECAIPADAPAWDELLPLALFHGVAPLLYANLKGHDLPEPIRAQLRSIYVANSRRNEQLLAEQARILAAFSEKSISVWPLKGPQLGAQLYGDAAIRQVADMDLLIRPADLVACDGVLASLGYARQAPGDIAGLRDAGELIYLKDAGREADQGKNGGSEEGPAWRPGQMTFAVDLQQRVLPYGQRDPLADRIRSLGMTAENLLLSLCVNQVAHRFARLKYLLDAAACLRKHGAALDWPAFLAVARELDFAPGIYLSLAWARSLADVRVPQDVLVALRPDWFTRRFAARVLGDDAVTTLLRGAALAGPYGALAILAATRPGPARWRQLWRMLFPPAAYLRQVFAAAPDDPLLPLYVRRLMGKLPAALRRRTL